MKILPVGKVPANTAWQIGDSILRLGLGLLLGIWLARYLGPEQFGVLNYALALVAIFAAFATLGLDDLLVRELVRESEQGGAILGTASRLRFGAGLLVLAAAGLTVALLRPGDGQSLQLVLIVAAGSLLQGVAVIEFWFHSRVEARYVARARSLACLLVSLLKIALILAAAPLVVFAWLILLEVVLAAAGLLIFYRRQGWRPTEWIFQPSRAVKLLRDGWPLMLSAIVIMVYLRIDQVMLGQLVGEREVGIYAVAVRLAEAWYFIPTALFWSVFPGIVAAKMDDEALFYRRLQKLYNQTAALAYVVALPVSLLATWLVPWLFGADYQRAGTMLAVLIWANVFVGLEMARSAFLTAMNWTRLYLLTVGLGCVINIGLNLWLIPAYGGMGAVIASLVAYWFAVHGSCFLFPPLRRTGGMLTRAIFRPRPW